MIRQTKPARMSAKKLASLDGKIPFTTITGKRKARRERPELTHRKAPDPWPKISLAMRLKWWDEADSEPLLCGICGLEIFNWEDLVPDHIQPGKMGGCKDHSESNLQPAHSRCNILKGSKRNGNNDSVRTNTGN